MTANTKHLSISAPVNHSDVVLYLTVSEWSFPPNKQLNMVLNNNLLRPINLNLLCLILFLSVELHEIYDLLE